jgi:hypothetical protein
MLFEESNKRGRSMEIQADVQTHRLSLCSEETIDSEKSGNTLDDGAASTRALAGSVLNYKVEYGCSPSCRLEN